MTAWEPGSAPDPGPSRRNLYVIIVALVGVIFVLPAAVACLTIVGLTLLGQSLESKFEAVEAEVGAAEPP